MIPRRDFFTAIGAAFAAIKAAGAAPTDGELDVPVIVVSPDACILCGYDEALKPWGDPKHPVMRCSDAKGCQDRQVNALLGTRTMWQQRTGTVMAKGKRR